MRARGIEVGHIFYFGTKYSEPMKAVVAGPDGNEQPVHMGSYGIGPTRLVGRDHRGLPRRGRHQVAGGGGAVQGRDPQPQAGRRRHRRGEREALSRRSPAKGIDVLYDDPTSGPAPNSPTADLIGIPWQVLVGPKGLAEGKVEIKRRADGARELLSPADAVARLDA